MALKAKYELKHEKLLRDARPWTERFAAAARDPGNATIAFTMAAASVYIDPYNKYFSFSLVNVSLFADIICFVMLLYFRWLMKKPGELPFKLPKSAKRRDPNFKKPDGSFGMADGILYLGNSTDTGEEIWFTNTDARTHCLYLGTTGSGKTFGLKSFAANALCWSSGFIYIDGKADTDLWSNLSALARRFGRDDDLLIMNYMTGNVGGRVPSNTLNPFSSGSASYLTNMVVSLMPESEGDNAMWKERAVSLISAIMPCLVWKRDNQNIPLSIGVVRTFLTFKAVIKLSRDAAIPEHYRGAIRAYLNELPGYVDNVFDDEGNEKPMPPDAGAVDTSVPRQQHGYLSMQFTRSMSSLGDDYGFIFDTQAADVDMMDVVLNRRILVVLIPALEKSGDETANLGKIISSTLKGMMGATLGSSVEGDVSTVIENKLTTSSTPFMAIFDEVGYYTAQGMAVMAAQARSLGFSLVFSAQDLPALEKRVKEEARSITANCNIKLFGKLEDPTQTKEFFEKTVGTALVTEVSGFARPQGGGTVSGYADGGNASVQSRARAGYDGLKGFNEGRAICSFGKAINEMQIYNSDIGHAKAMRVHRFLPIPPPAEDALESLRQVDSVLRRFRNPKWDPANVDLPTNPDIDALVAGFSAAKKEEYNFVTCGALAVASVANAHGGIKAGDVTAEAETALGTKAKTDGRGRQVPPVLEAERMAAEAVAKTTGKGPMSWLEIIGAGGAVEASPFPPAEDEKVEVIKWEDLVKKTPPVAAAEEKAAEEIKSPLSWSDVLGLPAETQQKSTPPSLTEEAQEKKDVPISWADVIGADLDKEADDQKTKK